MKYKTDTLPKNVRYGLSAQLTSRTCPLCLQLDSALNISLGTNIRKKGIDMSWYAA